MDLFPHIVACHAVTVVPDSMAGIVLLIKEDGAGRMLATASMATGLEELRPALISRTPDLWEEIISMSKILLKNILLRKSTPRTTAAMTVILKKIS